MLLGRHSERETLDRLVGAVRQGESRALVVRGEPGVGKTALLESMVDRSAGCRVARATGAQSEMELAFAGLHQLCAPMLDRLDRLPPPQRDALATVFGLRPGPAPDRFLIGLAVLTLLSEVAEERPLLCLVDDAMWLDHASALALAFAARRLLAESVGLVFAARAHTHELTGLPELVVQGLPDADARALLGSVIPGVLDARVRDRIVAETRGNPLALLELPRGLTPAELAGGFGLPGARALPGRIEASFRHRLEALPDETRRLLLLAAAEPLGDPVLLWRAAARLGLEPDAASSAVADGLIELAPRVRFRHPLARSAVYGAAEPGDRQRVHAALAAVTDADADPDRRAWHRAQAAPGPDAAVAEELVRSADRAQARGGVAAAAAFLERAGALTLDPARRAQRMLAAAQAKHEAGAFDAALGLLAEAEAGPPDDLVRARAALLRGRIAFARGSAAGPALLLEAAQRLEPLDVDLARQTYLEALSAAMFAGRVDSRSDLLKVAEAARAASPASGPADLLLDGLALWVTEGTATAAPALKRAVRAFGDGPSAREGLLRWLWVACVIAFELWDAEAWEVLSTRQLELARETGALALLPMALMSRIGAHLEAGRLAAAAALVQEQEVVTDVTGTRLPSYRVLLAGLQGREADVTALIEATTNDLAARGDEQAPTLIHAAAAILFNGLGRYDDALSAARRATARPWGPDVPSVALVELVEAAARSGRREEAAAALTRLSASTRGAGTDWALGIESRCSALLADGDTAERLYRDALERLGRTRLRLPLARAHLLYGEWLRRENRRLDAREQLRTAHGMYAAMGAEAHAARAARELLATGESVRKRTIDDGGRLTPQEAQIARLAREGLSNPEIGARLFISPRTVQYHLRKVFAKLGINSRTQLPADLVT